MKKNISLGLIFLFQSVFLLSQTYTWMHGVPTVYSQGSYGVPGVFSPAFAPTSRMSSQTWTDTNNNLWLMGGSSQCYGSATGWIDNTNDLWKYDITTNQWALMKGTAIWGNQLPVYGTMGVPATNNIPSGRSVAATWSDASGNLWLYGGWGHDGNSPGRCGDLWSYNISTNMWTWVNGSSAVNPLPVHGTQNVPNPLNTPGARIQCATWIDSSNNLWLFGGRTIAGAQQFMNDLWKYNPTTNEWTWLAGSNLPDQSGNYGTIGISSPSNQPSSRCSSSSWTDNSGNFWLFGGSNYAGGYLNDVWKFDTTTHQWIWMSGDTTSNRPVNHCMKFIPTDKDEVGRVENVSWRDLSGDLWIFGGFAHLQSSPPSFGSLNDLWHYSISSNKWTWEGGSDVIGQAGIYGTQAVPASTNIVGARFGASGWADQSGGLWLFGGTNSVTTGPTGPLNDLWKIDIASCSNPVVTSTGTTCIACGGSSYTLTASGATSYSWSNGQTSHSIIITPTTNTTIALSFTNQNSCSSQMDFAISYTPSPIVNIASNSASICMGSTINLTATGALRYLWSGAQTNSIISITPLSNTNYSVAGVDTNGCYGYASKYITVKPLPVVTASVFPKTVCAGETATLMANGAQSYSWDNLTQSSQNMAIFVYLNANTHFVVGTSAEGCKSSATVTLTIFNCTDIESIDYQKTVKMYPNPNSGIFTVNNSTTSQLHFIIFNSLGQTVFEKDLYQNQNQIKTYLSSGLYTYTIMSQEKKIDAGKIIIE